MGYVKIFINILKLITNTSEEHDKNKESSYLKYWDVNIVYVWPMLQKFPGDSFKWVEVTSKKYTESSDSIKKLIKTID